MPPRLVPAGFEEGQLANGRTLRFLGVLPIYSDEMRFKLERGTDALHELLDEHGIADVVDRSRSSVVPKQRGFPSRW